MVKEQFFLNFRDNKHSFKIRRQIMKGILFFTGLIVLGILHFLGGAVSISPSGGSGISGSGPGVSPFKHGTECVDRTELTYPNCNNKYYTCRSPQSGEEQQVDCSCSAQSPEGSSSVSSARASVLQTASGFGPSAEEEARTVCNLIIKKKVREGWTTGSINCSPPSFCYIHCVPSADNEHEGC